MVVKTEVCSFSELKIYPGRGRRYVRKDGKLFLFIDRKVRSLHFQKKKNQRLQWTQAWRRKNKKVKVDTSGLKKKVKRTGKVFKTIQGISMEELKKRRAQKVEVRQAQSTVALTQLKERKKKEKEERRKVAAKTGAAAKPASFVKVPKHIKTTVMPGKR